MRMPEGISDTDFLLLEVLWQKGKKQFFIVRNADMNLRNGWPGMQGVEYICGRDS